MAKKNNTLKQFKFSKKEDYLFVLEDIIGNSYMDILEYGRYIIELRKICEENESNGKVNDQIYRDIKAKLLHSSSQLLKFIADKQSDSMSYNKFRELFNKSNTLGIKLDENKQLDNQLSELLNLRNWTFHNPQSLLVAQKELKDKEKERMEKEYLERFPKEFRKYITPMKDYGLILIEQYDYCDLDMLISLYKHNVERYKVYDKIIDCMISDYSKILGREVIIKDGKAYGNRKLFHDGLAIANLSMAIQSGKYKENDDEKFSKITMKKLREEMFSK
ncbi:hypothetical protein QTI54_04675 [Clostridium perfringens]|uniref:hypothetical protein n=1 Tax=Clostridium perfringens TaxID=1502 RepID=UPI002A21F464|nr:hypothetical protein [Clostridium perfringens]EJT6471056.1 hypothetical protein [Clostridium perfringens]MDM0939827.1 hypothetical protein [Clostridium perfringens]